MLYPNLKFPKVKGRLASLRGRSRPFFYTNFVQTLDGKVAVKLPGYWPIGSREDYEVLTQLRAYADCLIHGKNLAKEFGEITKKGLNKSSFKNMRRGFGKSPELPYIVASHNLRKLVQKLHKKGYKHILVEGGPTLLGSFLKENLLDEIFLTIAPKIYGTSDKTLTLVEGILFSKNSTKKLKLLSVKPVKDEVFLHYKVGN